MVGFATKRPTLVSIVCIIGWLMVVLCFMYAFSPTVKKMGEYYPALYSLIICLQFIAFVGVWYMKRWGQELFVFSFFAKSIVQVLMNDFSAASLTFVLSILFILVLVFFYRRMDRNL